MIQKYKFSIPKDFDHDKILYDLSFVASIKNVKIDVIKRNSY